MSIKQISRIFIAIIYLLLVSYSCKKHPTTKTGSDQYFPQVKVIIQNNCLPCHSSTGTWAGRPTAFDSDSAISAQYDAIKASVADSATMVNKRMPQGGTLQASDVDIIVRWFNKGGKVSD